MSICANLIFSLNDLWAGNKQMKYVKFELKIHLKMHINAVVHILSDILPFAKFYSAQSTNYG